MDRPTERCTDTTTEDKERERERELYLIVFPEHGLAAYGMSIHAIKMHIGKLYIPTTQCTDTGRNGARLH